MRGTIKKVLAIGNYSENPFSQHQSKPVGYLLFRKKIPLTFSKIDKFVFRKKKYETFKPIYAEDDNTCNLFSQTFK